MITQTRKDQGLNPDRDLITVTNPITGATVGQIDIMTADEVRTAVGRARYAQKLWAARTFDNRLQILRRFQHLLLQNQQQIIRIVREETGKAASEGFAEVIDLDLLISWLAGYARGVLSRKRRKALFPLIQSAHVYYKPRGVVGIISPWNYPLALPFMDAIPALLAGNAVVLKPSEMTPFTSLYCADLLHQAGVPQEIMQVVTGDGSTGAALIDYVDYIGFTGSTATGRKVAMKAAERLIPCTLELGGKDAMIVLRDADIELAASGVVAGAMQNTGQMCVSIERVYVEAPLYEKFVERVVYYVSQLKIGSEDHKEIYIGSMTNERELLRVEAHIRDAVERGARLMWGGSRRPDLGPLFIEPAVLADVTPEMLVMQEETFGPLIPIMKVESADEAVRLTNESEYGLSSSVFTRDLKKGVHVGLQLNTGDVSVNRTSAVVIASQSLPWGGQKNSGIGRRNGPEGLLRFVTTQSILVDRRLDNMPSFMITDTLTLSAIEVIRRIRRVFPYF